MGRGWFDFRSSAQRERDYRDFNERVFSGGLPHKRKVKARLQEALQKKDVTYELVYYTALKDLLVRRPQTSFEEGLRQVCGEIRVMKLDGAARDALRRVLEEDMAGKLG